ncbi:MAG: SPOR domain-containing protein [Comamonadaceae bacterium]|nr:MAG: SPOR domain-containing protein [Comamonadaceae bacterium]
MPFFKFRKNGAEQQAPSVAPESHDVLRKRARHRLIGTATLVLVGVIGFPLLFDTQPRPIAVDIPIEIPDKAKVEPLAPVAPPVPAASEAPLAKPAIEEQAPAVVVPPVEPVARETPLASPPAKPAEKAPVKVETKTDAKTNDAARAQSLLEGKPAETPAADATRYTVQIGAFADVLKAREARAKLEKAGIKTYTQVVNVSEGRRIRVRVGPMQGKEAANKMAEKIRKLDLPAAVLEL